MRAQRDSHLSSELWRSAAARSPGRSHSCLDPRWWSPGSDSSGTSSPHPPWYNKTPMELTVLFGFLEVELLRVCNCDSWGIPEAPASIRCAIAVLPHGHHLSGSERPAKANWEGALDVQDGRCPLWIHTKPHLKTLYHFCIAWHKIQYVYQRYLKDRSCVSLLFISIIWSKISFRRKVLLPAHLKLPDLLALLGNLPDSFSHQSDQHVEQQHEGEDDVGNQQDEEDRRILCTVDHVQFSHPDGQLKEVQEESAEGVWVPAVWVGGTVAITLCARWRTHRQQRHQSCEVETEKVGCVSASTWSSKTFIHSLAESWMRGSMALSELSITYEVSS